MYLLNLSNESARESYGDSAVGYVQVRRINNNCIIKGRICPKHKIREKPYFVTATVDEENEIIKELLCLSCVAALGLCKHAIAFMMWLHRRSEEPSPTEVFAGFFLFVSAFMCIEEIICLQHHSVRIFLTVRTAKIAPIKRKHKTLSRRSQRL
ncbi:hypothetical protein RN001_001771 [Aquatica leii]|uniref:SWIM-type domain-containing protein n=1 Tax=Aquatica leii TaxID=1421715 RepID=A0AAN7QAM5_9COLE|nr:hypothetical protein RN001_001771 [Aquatica leii]